MPEGGDLAGKPEVHTTGGRAGIVRRRAGARAGSRRGSHATTTASASRSPAAVATAAARPPRSTRSRTSPPVCTWTLRVASPRVRASASTPIPPVTVQAPKRCSTYAVTPGPGRHVAGVVPLGDRRVRQQPGGARP